MSGCKRVGKCSLMGLKSPCLVGPNHSVKRFFAQTREGRFDDRDAGTAGGQGGEKNWRAMETITNKKVLTNYACFCSDTMLISKI